MGAVDELNEIFSGRNNDDHKILSPNICDYDNRTGLHLAARHNQLDVVNFFQIEVLTSTSRTLLGERLYARLLTIRIFEVIFAK